MFEKLKTKFKNLFKKESLKVDKPVYMEKGSTIAIVDKVNSVNYKTEILPQHLNIEDEQPQNFEVVKTTSKDGSFGMTRKKVLVLNVDEIPTKNSLNLLTSGTIYDIVYNILKQIDELKTNK